MNRLKKFWYTLFPGWYVARCEHVEAKAQINGVEAGPPFDGTLVEELNQLGQSRYKFTGYSKVHGFILSRKLDPEQAAKAMGPCGTGVVYLNFTSR